MELPLLLFGPLSGWSTPDTHSAKVDTGYLHRSWTTENGLPQNSVTAALQTGDGHIWLGTFGGLVRFDGVEFSVFETLNTSALRSNRIRALYEDRQGNLWIGTEHGGLTRFRQGLFTNFSAKDGLPNNVVVSITGDEAGDLWIGTTSGLTQFHDGKFVRYSVPSVLPRENVTTVYHDQSGDVWVGTYSAGLLRLHRDVAKRYGTGDGLPDNHISALYADRQGRVWVGTASGLAEFKGERFSQLRARDGLLVGEVRSLCEDRGQRLWVGASGGLFRLEGGRLVRFPDHDLSDSNIRSLLVDREGDLWVGTDVGGLNQLRESSVIAYTAKRGLTDKATMATYADAKSVWIGALGRAGLFRFANGRFQVIARSASIASLAQDKQGNFWISDWSTGLNRVENHGLIRYPVPGMSTGDTLLSLYVDREGTLWMGADQTGLYRFRDGEFRNYGVASGLPDAHIGFITQDSSGALWLGTSTGITRLWAGRFESHRVPGLSLVRAIRADADGTLWIGTYGFGLSRFKNGKFTQITSKDGLFDDVVSCIVEDDLQNLWMSGNRGIFRVARSELDGFVDGRHKLVTSVSYGVADGMEVSETNGGGEPTCWKAADGKLWFAMIKGAVAIDPSRVNLVPPPVVIERVSLDGHPLLGTTPIRVSPDSKNLEIHYAALSFSRPEEVKFKYMLENLDQDWVTAESRRTAYFPHLPSGEYRFRVIAENGDGVWNREGASVAISVLPPFWRTGWFLGCLVAAIALASAIAYRLRVAHLMRVAERAAAAREAFSRQLLDSQEQERQRIAAELHDGLGQSLLIIKNRALLASDRVEDRDASREQLVEISSAASHAVEEVREICYNLRPYQLDRFGLTKTLNGMSQRAARTSGIKFRVNIEPLDGLLSRELEINIYRIVQEAVNNIIKHSHAMEAELSIRRINGELCLRIHDNGKGFEPSAASLDGSQRGGFGLIGIAERVRMLGGISNIESQPGHGTAILVKIVIPEGTREN